MLHAGCRACVGNTWSGTAGDGRTRPCSRTSRGDRRAAAASFTGHEVNASLRVIEWCDIAADDALTSRYPSARVFHHVWTTSTARSHLRSSRFSCPDPTRTQNVRRQPGKRKLRSESDFINRRSDAFTLVLETERPRHPKNALIPTRLIVDSCLSSSWRSPDQVGGGP